MIRTTARCGNRNWSLLIGQKHRKMFNNMHSFTLSTEAEREKLRESSHFHTLESHHASWEKCKNIATGKRSLLFTSLTISTSLSFILRIFSLTLIFSHLIIHPHRITHWIIFSSLSRATSVKSSVGIITHQGHITKVIANDQWLTNITSSGSCDGNWDPLV